jgi:glycine oxidase
MRVAIVGGGVVGLSIALRLRDAGAEPIVLERSIPGAEASSAAAGMLATQLESSGPGPFLDLCLKSRALYPSFAADLRERSGLDIGYLPCGTLSPALDEPTLHRQVQVAEWQRQRGLRVERLDPQQVRSAEPQLMPETFGGLLFPDDHQVDNRLLVRALSQATARSGVEFRTGYVRGLKSQGDRVTGVDLDGVSLDADAVVVAAGSWTGLVPGLSISPQTVRPAKGQMVQLQLRTPLLRHVVYAEHSYLVPRADGRVICGSTVEMIGFDKQVTAGGVSQVLQRALRLCPALATATLSETWAGLRPYTDDELPILGRAPMEGLFLATGHFRNGILLAPKTAELMSRLILQQPIDLDLTPFRMERFGSAVGNDAPYGAGNAR